MPYMTRRMIRQKRSQVSSQSSSSSKSSDGTDSISGNGSINGQSGQSGGSSSSPSSASYSSTTLSGSLKRSTKCGRIRELPSQVDPPASSARSSSISGSSNSSKPSSASNSTSDSKKSKTNLSDNLSSASKSTLKSKSTTSVDKSSQNRSQSKSKSRSKVHGKSYVSIYSSKVKPVKLTNFDHHHKDMALNKILYMENLVKGNIEHLKSQPVVMLAEKYPKESEAYVVNRQKVAGKAHSPCLAMYETSHKEFKDVPMVCKVYSTDLARTNPNFLKMLRHLGRKHHNIVPTWDIFFSDESISVYQEYAPYGNMILYQSKFGPLSEANAQNVARQMYRAMDFMGDMGLCHRALCPSHVLVFHSDVRIKLTGFQSSIIYYGVKRENIKFQPCLAISCKGVAAYQAPEVYGDPGEELFDPITADIWSYGACLYNFLTGKYPYDQSKENVQIEEEMQQNVRELKIAEQAQNLIGHCLTMFSTKRLSVEQIGAHPWLQEYISTERT